jgi:hypothetical protein
MEKYITNCFSGNTKISTGEKMTAEANTLFPVLILHQAGYLPAGYKTIPAIRWGRFIILLKDRPNQAEVFCTALGSFILRYIQPEKVLQAIPKDSTWYILALRGDIPTHGYSPMIYSAT